MTLVEETVTEPASKKSSEQRNFAKIVEVTGIKDITRINGAISVMRDKNGSYEIADVIQFLVTEPIGSSGPILPTAANPVNTESEKEKNNDKNLTNEAANTESDDQLQAAIANSLRENVHNQPGNLLGGQISREDEALSRVLEQSLQENKAGTKQKRGEMWFVDPLNPHERTRDAAWPVGLKNVGNTCWFSCVIQSLFHLPAFRRLMLTFVPPSDATELHITKRRNLEFVHELRCMFALMISSKRKYIDPAKAVDILKQAFTSSSTADTGQQDLSEFQHKLLEWLEDSFKLDKSGDQHPPAPQQDAMEGDVIHNPVTNLFYGQWVSEGVNNGVEFKNPDTFGQFPLQVSGFTDIHESLEAETAQGTIESVSGEASSKSGQEKWLTRLPPVLTFELSRFQFNAIMGRTEKIHNRFVFPETLYLDRYLECNKCITRQKRSKVKKMKYQLQVLQDKLDKYVNYGSGVQRFPLRDVLEYALEFAENQERPPPYPTSHPTDVEMQSPAQTHQSMQTDEPDVTPTRPSLPPDVTLAHSHTTSPSCDNQSTSPPSKMSKLETPSPKHVSQHELIILQTCLRRWGNEVQADVTELQASISSLEEEINNMYTEAELKQAAYRLHAVSVHEGQAAAGHYWAYVYSTRYNKWLKYNDITVTDTTWCELTNDSFGGGNRHASAYCLTYVDARREDLLEDSSGTSSAADSLPVELEKYVNCDNNAFEREIEQWDQRSTSGASLTGATSGGGDTLPSSTIATQTNTAQGQSLAQEHASIACTHTAQIMQDVCRAGCFKSNDGVALSCKKMCELKWADTEAVTSEVDRQLPLVDVRLDLILVYLHYANLNCTYVIKRILVEQFALPTTLGSTPRAEVLVKQAKHELEAMQHKASQDTTLENDYKFYHEQYSLYRDVASAFTCGVEAYHKECFVEAMPYLCSACEQNRRLTDAQQHRRGLDPELLGYYRRQCLLQLNQQVCAQFENGERIEEVFSTMTECVIPAYRLLNASSACEDQTAVEEVRKPWFLFLSMNIPDTNKENFQDLLSILTDERKCTGGSQSIISTTRMRHSQLSIRYHDVMKHAFKLGELEGLYTAS